MLVNKMDWGVTAPKTKQPGNGLNPNVVVRLVKVRKKQVRKISPHLGQSDHPFFGTSAAGKSVTTAPHFLWPIAAPEFKIEK